MVNSIFDAFKDAYTLLSDKLSDWIKQAILLVPNVITALIVFLFFFLIGRFAEAAIEKLYNKYSVSSEIVRIVARLINICLMITGIFYALGILHLDKTVTSLLAGAGLVGLALSFAFQDIATNFVSGFIIALRKPFKVGDLVETNDTMGVITQINLRATHMKNFHGQNVIIPSKDVIQKTIKNYSSSGERRVELEVGVSYGEDLEFVTEITTKAILNVKLRDPEKDVEVYFEEFGDSSINMKVWFWIQKVHVRNFLKARHEAVIAIHKAYKEHDITIPFPIRTLDFGIKGGEKLSDLPGFNQWGPENSY